MKTLLNYQILELLGESMHSEVFKVHLLNNPAEILVLRQIKPQFNSPSLKDYLQQQIEQLSDLALPHTFIPHIDNPTTDSLFLVQNFFAGCPLTQWLAEHRTLKLENVLRIIIAIASRLEEVHKAGHIHKGLKPNNILLNPETLEVQLIDDVRVLDINQLSHFIYEEAFRIDTLPYLSPEQTGRIKYSVNYSTDLYAVGMILFEALTGEPPFLFDDPITILHSHLAEVPARIESINPDVPEILGDIVALLLEKAPEKRYQTASGLKVDLQHCLSEWQKGKQISKFTLKRKDYSNRITIPSLMVGRDQEKTRMLEEFSKSCSGVFRSALISGLSGIGKTRLIQELQLPIVSNYGYFCSGKFDQFRKHIPYSTLIQAFTHLIKTLLTEDSHRLDYWGKLLNNSLGENGRLMTDLIPELELIIGKQLEVPDLPPVEARNRFNDTAGKFIASFACKEHPLTLFIDDLQWCDGASFDLLERVFDNHMEYPYLFWIGAYRHNEVDDSHRLTRLIGRVKKANRPLLEIRLEALGLKEVNQMSAYILNTYPSRTKALSEVIYHTSAGNPLFVNESLRWLHTYRHLHLSEEGVWAWNDEQLRHAKIPDSALDLFKDKISKLSSSVQELLAIAANLGARFETADLALVAGMTLPQLYNELTEAFVQNILVREKQQLLFFHDQVQAAAASFMDKEKTRLVHHRIATAFIKAIPDNSVYEELPNLFPIVEHLAEGRVDNADKAACLQEARFNYAAGVVAMRALAMDNANFFFHQAKELYPDKIWGKDYSFLFSLYKYLARTEMALGNQGDSEEILETLIQQSRSDLDRVDCLYEQTTGLSSLGNFTRAIELGNRGLDFFNRRIPSDDNDALEKSAQIFDEIHKDNRDVWQEILDVEPSNNREIQIETGIYSELIPDYYLAGMVPQLYLSAIQSTQNCLAGGVDESVIYGFSMVGLYAQRKGQYDLSFHYEDLGLALAERYPDSFGATKGINGILWTNRHNRENSETVISDCQQNIHRGKNCGDLYNAGLSYGPYIWHLVHQGANMQRISEIGDECITFSRKFNLSLSLGLAESALAGWSAFMQLDSRKFSVEEIEQYLAKWENDKHVVSIGGYYTLKGIAHHYLGDYEVAAENLELAQPYLRGLSDNILNRLWYVFRYINGLKFENRDNDEEKRLAEYLGCVGVWSELGPILKPYLGLMFAETAFHNNNFSEARRCYLDAIDAARKEKFILLEAFLQQRTGELLITKQHEHADYHLVKAVLGFKRCGADVKAKQIMEKYSIVVDDDMSDNNNEISLAQLLDVNYLVEATREITQQLDLDQLLITIIKAVMERLGAKSGYLLIVEPEKLTVFAKGIKQDEIKVKIKDTDVLKTDTLSMAIVNYVHRTAEMVVLENASKESDFITDEVVIKQQLKSVLCLPLVKQQKVLGVLYLENNLIASVFSQQHIELTKLLTAQAAIALENTLLVEEMKLNHQQIQQFNEELEHRVEKRTEELHKVNEELKNFAYVVSHDLKAPLRAINQLSSWIEEDYADAFDDDGREQMTLLRSRAKRMHEMIDGILQYSRIGRIRETLEKVDLNIIITDVIEALSPPEHIKLEIQPQLPILWGEKLRVYQVMQNLLDNAIKYNDKPQGLIQFSYEDKKTDWCFCIKDNGVGIDEAYKEKVFQLFQTLSPKDQQNSTGIGLSLIEKIVNNWEGKIWLESELGKGSQFFFTFPKREQYVNE
ncbi:MAG: AAA family ATPase [Methylococcaceae bacterium]|nr:AAA family ATPase [Methylococcaceae bacterium]